jgi:threonine/homoserine/homoserine lactone efflux protein
VLSVLGKAIVLGFSVAAPVGPIGILCIRRTLTDGRAVGLACGLGAATADALYGLIAGLGLTALTAALVEHQAMLQLVGAVYVAVLGARTLVARPAQRAADVARAGALRAWLSTLVLTLTNPATIMSYVAMFAAIAPATGEASLLAALVLAGGCFLGSALWWLGLSAAVDRLRSRVEPHLIWVNRASGVLLLGFAAWALASAL